jgi:hypothetical protein
MSNIEPVKTDMSEHEQRLLAEFVEQGLPGIARVSDSDVYKWFNLYMSGKGYAEIADLANAKLPVVLFIGKKYAWFERKFKHLENLHARVANRVAQVQLESTSFLVDYIAYIHKKLGTKLNDFLAGDTSAADGISGKELDKYFKSVEALKALQPQDPNKNPPSGATIINNHGGTVNVDPKTGSSDIEVKARPLGGIADAKRAKQAEAKQAEEKKPAKSKKN